MKPTFCNETKMFQVSSGSLQVTDPCYEVGTWCAGQIDRVKNGIWKASVSYSFEEEQFERLKGWLNEEIETNRKLFERLGVEKGEELEKLLKLRVSRSQKEIDEYIGRVSVLSIAHEDYEISFDKQEFFLSKIDVGVDSGQAGFYDFEEFSKIKSEKDSSENFYRKVCNQTLGSTMFGTIEFGATSSSGYGDGGYSCYVKRDAEDFVVASMIVFISEDEEEDYDDRVL